MALITVPYPQTRQRRWAALTWTHQEIMTILRKEQRQSTRKLNPRRWDAYESTMDALEQAAQKGRNSFPGMKVVDLLCKAAMVTGWTKVVDTDPKPRVRVSMVDQRTEKMCSRCYEIKPMASFNTVATPEQKKLYGWNPEVRRYVVSKLCAECRPRKAEADRRKVLRSVKRKKAANPLHVRFHIDLERAKQAWRVVKARNSTTLNTENGPITFPKWPSPDVERFYCTRIDMVMLAKERLDAALLKLPIDVRKEMSAQPDESTDEGRLAWENLLDRRNSAYRAAGLPVGGEGKWQELLSTEERDTLSRLHRNAFGTSRRKPPALY